MNKDSRPSPTIKGIFQLHSYVTTGWPGKDGQDPDYFPGNYNDFKVDTNNDGIAEYLNVDVEVDIKTPGTYYITGSIEDTDVEGCGASIKKDLNAGIQTVSLQFSGKCIFGNKLNGPYKLSVYLMDETYTRLDYRINDYTTSAYNFMEFEHPEIIFTGNYNDFGVDEDNNGLFDHLSVDVEVEVAEAGGYEIHGNLYSGSTFIDEAETLVQLDKGVNTVRLKFDGVTIYANGADGPYTLKDLSLPSAADVNTQAYSYTQFQRPGASIVGVISDAGVDTDSDGLFNHLAVEVQLDSTLPDNYLVSGYLYDSSGRHITNAYNTVSHATGSQNVQLNFDGVSIRHANLDGPYKLKIELNDNKGAFISRTEDTTLDYGYTQFQMAPQDYFDITYQDHGTDTDNNGLYDYLTVELSISTIKSGNYRLEGNIYDRNGNFVTHDAATAFIDSQKQNIKLDFSGKHIWGTKILDGDYRLELDLIDNNNQRILRLKDAYITSKYDYTEFQVSIFFRDIYSDYKNDKNDDGFFEYLTVESEFEVEVPGNYALTGYLYDSNGNQITTALANKHLAVGTQIIPLDFDGVGIYKHQANGPYDVSFKLYDENGFLIDERAKSYKTSTYSFTEFKPLIILTGNYNDQGSDTDADGSYDFLTVNIEVTIANAGNVVASARLMDSSGEELIWATKTTYLNANQPQNIQLNFDGRYIYGNMMNDPYYVRDVYVYHTGDPTLPDYVYDAHTTAAYSYSQFEKSGVITGTVTDGGTPVQNAYISINGGDSDYTNSAGQYNLVVLQDGTYTVNIDAAGYASWKIFVNDGYIKDGTSVDVSATVGQVTDVDFTQQIIDIEPPIIESISLYPVNATPGAKINVTVQASDNVGVIEVTADGVSLIYSNGEWNHGSITAPSTIGSYTVTIRANDSAGNSAERTASYKVVKPTGSLGVGVAPKTKTVPGTGATIDYTIKIKSIQNFDDIVRVNITMDGFPVSYQMPLGWFDWNSRTIYIASNSTVSLPLRLTIPAGQTPGRKAFKVRANSTTWITTAFDSGVITIS